MSDASTIEAQRYAESAVEGYIIVKCPGCDDSMHLGQMWRELIDEGHDVPACPDCEPTEWRDGADVKLSPLEVMGFDAAE